MVSAAGFAALLFSAGSGLLDDPGALSFLRCAALFLIALAPMGVSGLASAIQFLRLKSWARTALELLSWICVLFFLGLGLLGIISRAAPYLAPGPLEGLGTTELFILLFIIAVNMVPFALAVIALRGQDVRNAFNASTQPELDRPPPVPCADK